MDNYYHKLGLSEDASASEIKNAFKKLAVKYHPDKNPGNQKAEELFKSINEAYQVLSNPYEKARYDLKLKYGPTEAPYQPNSPPVYHKKREYSEAPIDYRQNWIATAYAFGFTFVVAMIVMTGIWINNYVEDQRLQELLNARREQYKQAKVLYSSGDLDRTFIILNDLGGFHSTELDMKEFKSELIEEIIFKGQAAFNRKKYDEAIQFFEVLEKHAPKEITTLREKLAISYKEADMPHKSIKAFKELLTIGYRHISTYIQLAEIHRDQLQDFEMAKNYFQIASDFAIKYYRTAYGEAYPVLLVGKYIPPIHYQLYSGLADIYLRTGEPEMAIRAVKWNIEMWPDSAENYLTAAKSFESLNEIAEACDYYRVVAQLDPTFTTPFLCR